MKSKTKKNRCELREKCPARKTWREGIPVVTHVKHFLS